MRLHARALPGYAIPMLLACSACHRQYDVGDLAVGTQVRCVCGALESVPQVQARVARVMYCGNCGGALAEEHAQCAYCAAQVRASDRGIGSPCPECFSRMPEGARHCPACGIAIEPQAVIKAVGDTACPGCEGQLAICESAEGSFYECLVCAGVWLSLEAFQAFRERQVLLEGAGPSVVPVLTVRLRRPKDPSQARPNLRCPTCRAPMARRIVSNSRVEVDLCASHGWWFDGGELEELGEFLQRGGLRRAKRRANARAGVRRRRRQRIRRRREDQERAPLVRMLNGILSAFE